MLVDDTFVSMHLKNDVENGVNGKKSEDDNDPEEKPKTVKISIFFLNFALILINFQTTEISSKISEDDPKTVKFWKIFPLILNDSDHRNIV